eukprot:IDg3176t1
MGIEKSWDNEENAALARGWIIAAEDAIAGTDRKRKVFWEMMFRRFVEKSPAAHLVAEGQGVEPHWSERRKCSVHGRCASHWKVQHNGLQLQLQRLLFARTRLCSNRSRFFKSIRNERGLLRFRFSGQVAQEASTAVMQTAGHAAANSPGNLESLSSAEESADTSSGKPSSERFRVRGKNAKLIRQEELRTQAMRSLALPAKRKSDSLEEPNAISVFSRPDTEGLPETEEFFK